MEDNSIERQELLTSEEARAKAAILAECENLAAAGVTLVAVHFDGYGDSGVTEEVECFDPEYYAYEEQKPVSHDAAYLQEHFETLVPMGYENDCGVLSTLSSTSVNARSRWRGTTALKTTRRLRVSENEIMRKGKQSTAIVSFVVAFNYFLDDPRAEFVSTTKQHDGIVAVHRRKARPDFLSSAF